jgi:hypothetical protein
MVKGNTIHTFTREFTEIVLNELDTIKDFVDYMREKEKLISKEKQITLIGGEHELLAYYLMNQRSFENLDKADYIIFQDGSWDLLQKKPEYIAKKRADEISYGWDDIINRAHTGGVEYEKIARELARPNRFERRVLSKAFFDAHVMAHKEEKMDTFRRVLKAKGVTYCFVFLDDPEPRTRRKALLGTICYIARGLYPENLKVIGIATEMKIREFCSYDFCLLEIPEWTADSQKKMEQLQKETGIFLKISQKRSHEDEYPS